MSSNTQVKKQHRDFFDQEINIGDKVVAAINGNLRLCRIERTNKGSIIVKEIAYKNGAEIRTNGKSVFLPKEEDLTFLGLRKRIKNKIPPIKNDEH